LLALFGGAAGVLLAYAGARVLLRLAGSSIPFGSDVGFDPAVFAFLLIVAVGTGVVFGLVPAIQSTKVDLQADLKEGGGNGSAGRGRQRFRNLLVIGETAVALVLLVSAGLLMRAFIKLQNTDTGMVTRNVLTMHLSVPQSYDTTVSTRFYQPVLQSIKAIPGVRDAGLITLLPLQQTYSNGTVSIVGRPPDKPGNEPFAESRTVSPGYFAALGIKVHEGRDFTDQDRVRTAPVAIINHAFASKYFPNTDPVGRRIQVTDSITAPIVGVVADVRESRLDRSSLPTVYWSFLQRLQNDMALVISTTVPPISITSEVRAAIHSVDANQPVYEVKTMDDVVAGAASSTRFSFWLLGTFAAIALALAAVGIYGVMSYVVTQRTREIGIRMALGAKQRAVTQLIVRHGMSLAIAGLIVGVIVALALTRVLASLLYGASATDPATFAGVVLLLGIVALVASYVPARRAAAVNPVITLRSE
jgi:predicted permease